MSAIAVEVMTAEELLALPRGQFRYELISGELKRMPPTGEEHGSVTMDIAGPLHRHVRKNNLGRVYAAETGYKIRSNPDTVRAPDVSFISHERLQGQPPLKNFRPGAPDLAVEVMSPGDTKREVAEKVAEWLDAGAHLVWIVNPKLRTVNVYRPLTDNVILTIKDTLDGGTVVPGFRIAVSEIFG